MTRHRLYAILILAFLALCVFDDFCGNDFPILPARSVRVVPVTSNQDDSGGHEKLVATVEAWNLFVLDRVAFFSSEKVVPRPRVDPTNTVRIHGPPCSLTGPGYDLVSEPPAETPESVCRFAKQATPHIFSSSFPPYFRSCLNSCPSLLSPQRVLLPFCQPVMSFSAIPRASGPSLQVKPILGWKGRILQSPVIACLVLGNEEGRASASHMRDRQARCICPGWDSCFGSWLVKNSSVFEEMVREYSLTGMNFRSVAGVGPWASALAPRLIC